MLDELGREGKKIRYLMVLIIGEAGGGGGGDGDGGVEMMIWTGDADGGSDGVVTVVCDGLVQQVTADTWRRCQRDTRPANAPHSGTRTLRWLKEGVCLFLGHEWCVG